MSRIFATVRRTGWDDDTLRDFVANGMLINVMLSIRAPEHRGDDATLDQLSSCTLGDVPWLDQAPPTPLAGTS